MGIFDKLYGNKTDHQRSVKIDCTENGMVINRQTIQLPVKISILNEILGEPEEVKTDTHLLYIWNDKGIRGFSKDLQNVFEIDIQMITIKQNRFFPQQAFSGNLRIEGTDYRDFVKITQNDYIFKEYKIGNLELHVRLTKEEPKSIRAISINTTEKEKISPKEKDQVKKISGEKIEFADLNFKLAIIQELMFNQGLLQPQFDVYKFVKRYDKRKIDINKEGYEPIPEALEYFKNLEIDKKFAELVTEIYQDAGNNIYMNISPLWDGEDNGFNIRTYEDIRYFPNLKKMTLFCNDPKVFEELTSKGIDAQTL